MHRRRLIQFAAAAASAALLQPLRAQDKILRIVLPYGPGGITDVMTRMPTRNAVASRRGRAADVRIGRDSVSPTTMDVGSVVGTEAVMLAP